MQLAAGTFSGQGAPTTGTALLVKLTLSDGSAVTQDTQVTVNGPKGWNKDEPLNLMVNAKGYVDWLVTGFIPVVEGIYQASVNIAGQTYTATSGPVRVTNLLDAPNPVTVSDNGTQVRVTWPSVNNAVVYSSRIVNGGETVAGTYIFTRTIPATYASSVLAPNTDYTASVLAFNAALDTEKVLSVPAQFNASRAAPTAPFSHLP
ncbi:hypothetical protein GCM10008949_21260 [Deinococcus humi]|nr:hypothetical protein GCM10008949_21260 [Deinococcus humi]